MDTYYKIPKRLEEYRKRISFTQEQMGDIMELGRIIINAWKRELS